MPTPTLLFDGPDWDFAMIGRIFEACERIAVEELGLDVYPNQIEVITSEQMLDAYASVGMPLMYSHWSFGKHFAREEMLYRKGAQSLAYELVINSNPCVSYIMEENTAMMQTLVIAHAAFGHNHFFKNNHLFRQWTDADRVLDQLAYAKRFIAQCEEKYGLAAVESVLDAAHTLMNHGISRYAPSRSKRPSDAREKADARAAHEAATYNDLYRTLPRSAGGDAKSAGDDEASALEMPQENLLAFLANHAPKLADWQREILHIVRQMAQYFYPQRQTKMMNEGCATFVHYEIINRLFDTGQIGEGPMLEFLRSHTAVVAQPDFNDRRYGGINPYALGFAMMRDIQRICDDPDDEDRQWFPEFAGCGDAYAVLRDAWVEYRDESFVLQFLSPRLMRDMHLFAVHDESELPFVAVEAIHDDRGYRQIRSRLSGQYDLCAREPEIEAVEADLKGNRRLVLRHSVRHGRLLAQDESNRVLCHIANLWGYRVKLIEVDIETGKTLNEYDVVPMPG